MSRKRKLTSSDTVPSRKGPHGNRQCRWCRGEVFPPRKTYCSDSCVHEWNLRSDVAYLRSQLFLRDKGICADCGLDTVALRRHMYDLTPEHRARVGAAHGIPAYQAENLMLWEADHIVAVVNGGGLVGLTGFATRCVGCHLSKTKKDLLEAAGRR